MKARHTCSAPNLACKPHKSKHSLRYTVTSVSCCDQQLLLYFISQVAHKILCLLKFASTRSCHTVIDLSMRPA
jgi:hypothetical protein